MIKKIKVSRVAKRQLQAYLFHFFIQAKYQHSLEVKANFFLSGYLQDPSLCLQSPTLSQLQVFFLKLKFHRSVSAIKNITWAFMAYLSSTPAPEIPAKILPLIIMEQI